jgi:hypothetical protein
MNNVSSAVKKIMSQKWTEKDDIISFSVTFNDKTYLMNGEQWFHYFKKEGRTISKNAKTILLSKDFDSILDYTISGKNVNSFMTHEICILRKNFFSNNNCITKNIIETALKYKFIPIQHNCRIMCLVRKKLSNEDIIDMKLNKIIFMSKPIKDCNNNPSLLCVDVFEYDDDLSPSSLSLLSTESGEDYYDWNDPCFNNAGFVFENVSIF